MNVHEKAPDARANPREQPGQWFWLVWRADGYGHSAPTFAHGSRDSARSEARRLASLNPGVRFFVLRAEGSFQIDRPQPQWTDAGDGIPF